jgi:biotin carboxyl carrier protein
MSTDATSPVTPPTDATAPATAVRRRWLYAVLVLAFLFVLMPFLFWQSTWFGKPLTDAQIAKYFADTAHPRKAQHALSQISDRMASPDTAVRESAKRWYPQVVTMAGSPQDELRVTAAWVMGQDNGVPEFHQALLRMMADANPMVGRNAALSLVRFQDTSGRNIIVQMLQAYSLTAPSAGKLSQRLKMGDIVNPGTMVAHIEQGSAQTEVRSKVPGTIEQWLVADGSTISPGQPLLQLSPSPEVAWEALRALFLVGTRDDIPVIDAYMRSAANLPPSVIQQASLTRDSIRARNP